MSQAGKTVGGFVPPPPGEFVQTLTGNSGGAVGPDGANNINVIGSSLVTVAGNPGTNTLTINVSGAVASQFSGDTGVAIPSGGNINIIADVAAFNCGSSVEFTASGSTVQLNVSDTNSNTIVGSQGAGNGTLSGSGNTGFGGDVLLSISSSSNNSACGFFALGSLTSGGGNNCALGQSAGSNLRTGSDNIIIGDNAGANYGSSESGNICIAGASHTGENNVTRIGGDAAHAQTKCFISGIDGVNVGSTATVITLGTGATVNQLGTAVITAGTGISIAPGVNTITIAASSAVAESFPTDSGTATPSSGVLDINGDSHNITTTGSGNTVTVGLTGITQHSLQVGGASNALTQLGVATNGQLPIGSTGADPVLATLTAGTGISISNGAGSITISTTGTTTLAYTAVSSSPYVVLTTDDFLGVNSSGGAITIQLPNAPVTGRMWTIKDSTGSAATHNITVTTVGGAVNIDGATTFVMNTAYEAINVLFDGSTYQIF